MDCARRLTDARYGVIVTVDERHLPRNLTFSGLTPEQEREILAWPDGLRLFELLRNLPAPSRLPDFPGYVSEHALDAPWIFSRTYLGTPLHHRGVEVGHFFLGDPHGAVPVTMGVRRGPMSLGTLQQVLVDGHRTARRAEAYRSRGDVADDRQR